MEFREMFFSERALETSLSTELLPETDSLTLPELVLLTSVDNNSSVALDAVLVVDLALEALPEDGPRPVAMPLLLTLPMTDTSTL